LWGSAADDVWAVGDAGLALHWDGTTWTPIEAATLGLEANDLYTVWGTGKDDVWIAGRDALLHNGKALSSRLVP
jgi:hypothetical protein